MSENGTEQEYMDLGEGVLSDAPKALPAPVSSIPVVPQLGVALGLLVFVFGITYLGATRSLNTQNATPTMSITENPEMKKEIPVDPFIGMALEAKAAIVWDARSGEIFFEKNKDAVLPLASITKLMTALLSYELLEPDERISINETAIRVEGDSGFTDGEVFTMQDLADLTLITSSNDGATALSGKGGALIAEGMPPEEVFVKAMNVRAEELGLSKTSFSNATGLDLSATTAGAYGSAEDVAHLMGYIVARIPDAVALTNLGLTTVRNESGGWHTAENTNPDVAKIDGLIASKTGYTELSGGNLVVAFNAGLNRPVVVAVLGSSFDGRFADVGRLIDRARIALSQE